MNPNLPPMPKRTMMDRLKGLFKNIRFYVLVFSLLVSVAFYLWAKITIPGGTLQTIRLTQIFGFASLVYLYLSLLAGPFCYTFSSFPYKVQYLKARRALGVSAFYFAFIHSYLAFFGQLEGFSGLGFLTNTYLLSIILGFIALVILFLMTITSLNIAIRWLNFKRWRFLHRFVYLAGILILIHTLMLGTHFADLSSLIPVITFVALAFLMALESSRIDAYLMSKFPNLPKLGVTTALFLAAAVLYFVVTILPAGQTLSFDIHAQHIQLAKDAQNGLIPANITANFPGLSGDRTKRFTVSFYRPDAVKANSDTPLSFLVFDASSGNPVNLFSKIYDKPLHLIIVDSQLQYFTHIHPDLTNNGFQITTQFPHDGVYHLYLDFQPLGAIEQQFGFTLGVGDVSNPTFSTAQPDTNLSKVFGDYQVTLSAPSPLVATKLSIGEQKISFNIKDAKTGEPITTLKPYLAAFGHLVMVNQDTFDYLHVHPTNITPPAPDANGGPDVEFMPLGLYGPIKPGIYRVFGQFNPNGQLMVADFTIKIE